MNKWERIKAFYTKALPGIMATKSNEWGCEIYEWEEHGVHLTQIESWLWHDMRSEQMIFYPQFPVMGFFADFAHPKEKAIIECDGAAFHKDKEKDAARDKKLRAAGWHVYRITGADCRDGVGMEDEWNSKARKFLRNIGENHNVLQRLYREHCGYGYENK